MFATYDGQPFYFDSWGYNSARILKKLAQIVENNGGVVKYYNNAAIVHNRSAWEEPPIKTTLGLNWITFILNGVYYSFDLPDNYFFPFHLIKTKVLKGGLVSRDACAHDTKKNWLFDCYLVSGCSDTEITEAAHIIFNMFVSIELSKPILEKHKVKVPNVLNNGYHYEYTLEKERFKKLDWGV